MILKTLKVVYPYHFKELTTDEQVLMIRLWESMFKDEPYADVMRAVQKWSAEHKYMPSIAELKESLPKRVQIEQEDVWHKRFGYGSEPIYFDDAFSESVIWADIPRDIFDRLQYHCNPKDYAEYNERAKYVHEKWGNPVKIYTDEDTEFLKGKLTTWKNELVKGASA